MHTFSSDTPTWTGYAPDGAPSGELLCFTGSGAVPPLAVHAGARSTSVSVSISAGVCPTDLWGDRMTMEAMNSPADFDPRFNQVTVYADNWASPGATVEVMVTSGKLCVKQGSTVDPYSCSSGTVAMTANDDGDLTISAYPMAGFSGCSSINVEMGGGAYRMFMVCAYPFGSLTLTAS